MGIQNDTLTQQIGDAARLRIPLHSKAETFQAFANVEKVGLRHFGRSARQSSQIEAPTR